MYFLGVQVYFQGSSTSSGLLMLSKGRNQEPARQDNRKSWKLSRRQIGPEPGGAETQDLVLLYFLTNSLSQQFMTLVNTQPWNLVVQALWEGSGSSVAACVRVKCGGNRRRKLLHCPWDRFLSSFPLRGIFCNYLLCHLKSPFLAFTNEAHSSMDCAPHFSELGLLDAGRLG